MNYNKNVYNYGKNNIKYNPSVSKRVFEEYLEMYPKDYFAYIYYSKVLINLGYFNDALKVLKCVKEEALIDNKFNNNTEIFNYFMQEVDYNTLRIYCYLDKFEDVIKFLNTYTYYLEIKRFKFILYIAKIKLGLYKKNNNTGYKCNQLLNYSESEFLKHISKHLESNIGESVSTFNESFDVEKVLNEVKKYIQNGKCYYYECYSDSYIFKFDNCGMFDNKNTNYFIVVTFHNTPYLISMYPCSNTSSNLEYVDLNYLKETENKNIKRLSRIDKFNKRFNK